MHPHLFLCCALLIGSSSIAEAQDSASDRLRMATNHLQRVAAQISKNCLEDVNSRAEWDGQRAQRRSQLMEMLGLASPPARSPLKPVVTGVLAREKYRIEKLVLQSMPGLYVTGNFYIPHGAKKLPTILYLCGHAPHPAGAKTHYQDRAQWFAANGYACLILDTLEFGEVAGIHHGVHDLNMWHWLSLGYTPAGTEVWNAMRAIDYLETRPEVDAKRIGLTGISGGGAITWFTAALDDRVAAAAPVCSTYTFGSQAEHWRSWGQCDCIYFHNTYGIDFPVVAALIAPRPLLIVSGRKDGDFPPDGYRAVYQRAKKIFDFYGADERIREFDDDVGHADPPQFLREARQWMQRWLKNDDTMIAIETNTAPREIAEDLACLKELPADAINDQIHNRLTRPIELKIPKSRKAWEQRRADIERGLNEKVYRWFPRTNAPFDTRVSRNDGGWANRYGNYKDITFQTETGVRVRAQLITPKTNAAAAPQAIYIKRPGDSIYFLDLDQLLPLLGRASVLILNPRFTEGTIPHELHRDIQMTSAWAGRTIAAMQIFDVVRAIEWALTEGNLTPSQISVYGKGEMGIVSLYAALREPRVTRVILDDPPDSHWKGPALLNVLRITDIPEVAGMLAPRKLVMLNRASEDFALTRGIYRIEKSEKQFSEAQSLNAALK